MTDTYNATSLKANGFIHQIKTLKCFSALRTTQTGAYRYVRMPTMT